MNKVVRGQLWPDLSHDVRDDYDREACGADGNAVVPLLSMMGWTRTLNLRARAPPQRVTRRFKLPANTKLATVDSELKSLQDKHVKPLVRLVMHGLGQSIVRLSSETEDSVRGYAEQAEALLKVQSQYFCSCILKLSVAGSRRQCKFSV